MDKMKHRRLQELDRSDFEIVDGQPDIRGWDVKNTTGRKIGEVEDLIIDAKLRKVRYMVVDLDDNELDLDDRKVLLPIGLAELHKDDDDVIIPSVQVEQLRSLPEYHRDRLDAKAEREVCSILGRKPDKKVYSEELDTDPEFYKHDYYNDDNLYRHRLQEVRKKESDYEKGLRLWERRSEGGIIPGSDRDTDITGRERRRSTDDSYREREIEEDARMQMIRDRRNYYQQRRNRSDRGDSDRGDRTYREESVERRIRNEGLRDPEDI